MKKVLITILIILLVILAYFAMFNGLSFGNVKVLSVEQIIEANDELTNDIEEVTSLLKKDYPEKKEELTDAVEQLLKQKEEYYSIAKVSTEGEIAKANTVEIYKIEYLWTVIGRHATSKGINLKMDVKSGDAGEQSIKNLAFTVTGQYTGIIQFVSELENDDDLNFKIENFKMTKNNTDLTATFNVRGVRIKTETMTTTGTSTQTTDKIQTNQDTQDANNTNIENDIDAIEKDIQS